MPTDDERRKIAGRLRRCSPTLDNALTFFRVFEAVYGTLPEDGAAMGMPRHLANLIDRPTTTLTEDEDGRTCCANCGGAALYMSDAVYCPDCGLQVARRDGQGRGRVLPVVRGED